MSQFIKTYMLLWGLACLAAVILMFRLRASLVLFQRPYWTGLLQSWKVASFVVATLGLVVIAPYTGDPTWDYIDATFMSVLTFATAPWAVGTIYLTIRHRRGFLHAYAALCVWMFSASWSYDLYLLFRDGYYPVTWFENIFASSLLYLPAGLLWSLESIEGRGVVFGFMQPEWPAVPQTGSPTRLLWYALPLMILAAGMIVPFLL